MHLTHPTPTPLCPELGGPAVEVGQQHHPPRLRPDGGQGQGPHPPVGGQHPIQHGLLFPLQLLGTTPGPSQNPPEQGQD